MGINSPSARVILSEAPGNHPNGNVHWMISARLSLLTVAEFFAECSKR